MRIWHHVSLWSKWAALFLEETQTLTKYRHRLVALARSVLWIPKIRTLGETQERLLCSLDGENVEVLPDSGSEVDVMSHSYALRRGFSMESTQRWIMLADGSIEKTCGLVVAQLTVGYGAKKLQLGAKNTVALSNYELGHEEDVIQTLPPPIGFTSANSNQLIKRPPDKEKGERVYRNVIESEFHILKGLTVDVLVGAGSLESLEVYTHHSKDLIVRQSQNPSMAQLNRIILLGTVEQKLRQISRTWLMWGPRDNVTAAQNIPFEQYLSEADQRENARREMARENLRMLTGNERRNAETEESTRQANYDQYRAMLLQAFEAARTTP
ncbi:hypothetical protein K469DRAFT_232168 [Zopfia rhizophila CBS 207.26]|uniref:Uncharacterized protein n=1 Tax=Zopfia rhizophila CBS 207.26 TaxID=1314779 RepID=A0A6A6DVG5_9PEZI|nr:hypothetical protein K469DRAFT_232168 [Zopfia rhizophila CBS 207.26]